MIMKQFNLDELKKNPNRNVVTRSGRSVRILCTDVKGDCPVLGLALNVDGEEFPVMCSAIGESDFEEDDLFFDTVTNDGWVNIYKIPDTGELETSIIFDTKSEAEFYSVDNPNYVTTTKITWEEEL